MSPILLCKKRQNCDIRTNRFKDYARENSTMCPYEAECRLSDCEKRDDLRYQQEQTRKQCE